MAASKRTGYSMAPQIVNCFMSSIRKLTGMSRVVQGDNRHAGKRLGVVEDSARDRCRARCLDVRVRTRHRPT